METHVEIGLLIITFVILYFAAKEHEANNKF
jgi:hypothetical protein